jgi:sugar transferase (PEP-CTERM/EpsH1 system associated)
MNAPPLIAHVIYSLSTGGLENGLVNIINRMPPGMYRHAIICITKADEFAQRITAENVQIYELNKKEGHDWDFYFRLRKLFKELRPDIVHSRNLAALETQLLTLGLPGIRRVHGEHGREIGDLDGSNRKYLLVRKAMRFLVHEYIAVSQDIASWLVQRVGVSSHRVTQIYNGVDHARFKPGSVKPLALLPERLREHDGILIVGTVGRLSPVKDQQLLLHAMARLRDDREELFNNTRLLLIGDGPLRESLESLATTLSLEAQVWFAGDRQDVPELLQLMDVFVLPSLGEGISNTILEAMASGLPVVATAVGGNLELVESRQRGALVPSGDAASLAREIGDLLASGDGRKKQGLNAQKWVSEKFDWDKTVKEYLNVYAGVLGTSS